MTDIGFRSDKGHGDLVTQLSLAQIRIHDEGKFVSRAKTGRHLHRTDYDMPRVLNELLPIFIGFFGMIDGTDGMGMTAGAQVLYFIESQIGTGRNDKIVVIHHLAICQNDLVIVRYDFLGRDRDEINVLFLQVRL